MDRLVQKSGNGTELISLYIPPTKQVSGVVAHLREEFAQCSNVKSKSTRVNVQGAIKSILSRLSSVTIPENGLVIFCGNVVDGVKSNKIECIVIEPPALVTSYLYRCGSSFELSPLRDMMDDKPVYGLLVIDASDAAIGLLQGNTIITVKEFSSLVPRKHSRGGQSAPRFERLRDIALHEFFKKVADAANELFLNVNDFHSRFNGLVIGGLSPTKDVFVKNEYLHHEVRKKILGVLDTSYTTEYGLYELMRASRDLVEDEESKQIRSLTERLITLIATEGKAAYGYQPVYDQLECGNVEILLISAGIDREMVSTFTTIAKRYNTAVVKVPDDFDDGAALRNAFGGVGAILRW